MVEYDLRVYHSSELEISSVAGVITNLFNLRVKDSNSPNGYKNIVVGPGDRLRCKDGTYIVRSDGSLELYK